MDNPIAQVEVASAWSSKINWTQFVGGAAMMLTFATGGKVGLTGDQQAALVTVIGLAQAGMTWFLRTYKSRTVTPGSVASTPPNVLPIVVKVLIAAFLLSAFLPVGSASAQTRRLTGNIVKDIAAGAVDNMNKGDASRSSNPVLNALSKPFQDLANFIANDADGAATLATQIPQLQDVNGKACWVKMQAAGAVFKAHPVPVTFQVMTDFEAFRLLQMTANDLCTYTPCTVVFSDTANLVTSVASAVGGVLTSQMTPQSLTQLCSRIPQLAPQLPSAVTGIAIVQPSPTPLPSQTPAFVLLPNNPTVVVVPETPVTMPAPIAATPK